jgi:hypothetical protein
MASRSKLLLAALAASIAAVHATGCNLITGADGLSVEGDGGAGGGATKTTSTSASSSSSGASSSTGSSSSSTSASSSSSSSSSSTSASSSSSSASSSSSSTSASSSGAVDPWEQNRQACIDKINALRATKGLAPYQRWTSAEMCVDDQATHDAQVNKAHDAFSHGTPACGGYGQNECPGWGANAITGCLDAMWAEKDQPGCAGCDACDTFQIFQGNCPNCVFNGATVCGHYVNMSSKTFTAAACGFSDVGGWAAINFE